MKLLSMKGKVSLLMIVGGMVVLVGCIDRELAPSNPCTRGVFEEDIQVSDITQVDLLFVIDDSNSMAEEQGSLRAEIPRMIQALTTGRLDPSQPGMPRPVQDLHVGVVSTDLGTPGSLVAVSTCGAAGSMGRDGALVSSSMADGCADVSSGGVLSLSDALAGGSTTLQYAENVSCLAELGDAGCGIEQPLEAALKALTPSTSPLRFFGGQTGHGDGRNAGFLRPDSLLAVIFLTDEDDCSISDPTLYGEFQRTGGRGAFTCWDNPDRLHSIERFADGLLALRPGAPERLIFSVIGGLPNDGSTGGEEIDFETLLNHPAMAQRPDESDSSRRRPVCSSDSGRAFPARRLVRLASELAEREASVTLHSICTDDFRPAVSEILRMIYRGVEPPCLRRELAPDERGLVGCEVLEILPSGGEQFDCTSIPGRRAPSGVGEPARLVVDGVERQVCYVQQHPARLSGAAGSESDTEPGWRYEELSPSEAEDRCPTRIAFSPGSEPRPGTLVRLACLQPQLREWTGGEAYPGATCSPALRCEPTEDGESRGCGCAAAEGGDGCRGLGAGCEATDCRPVVGTGVDADDFCGGTLAGVTAAVPGMICERQSQTCRVACRADADCREHLGRGGYTCDPEENICVNPICE